VAGAGLQVELNTVRAAVLQVHQQIALEGDALLLASALVARQRNFALLLDNGLVNELDKLVVGPVVVLAQIRSWGQ
jgi:hypothetical protein